MNDLYVSERKHGGCVRLTDRIQAAGQRLTERLDMGESEMDFPMDLRLYGFERRAGRQHHFHHYGLWT